MRKEMDYPMQVDRVSSLKKQEFDEAYGFNSKPVLISDVMDDWRAKYHWTNQLISEKFGFYEEYATRVNNKNDRKLFKVSDYLNYMDDCTDPDPYYLNNCKFHLKTEMAGDYSVPGYFSSCLDLRRNEMPLESRLSWLYIGASNTFSGLHLDIYNTSAWNAMVSGRKRWLFYPPGQSRYLYNGLVNPFKPDLEKYPEFSKASHITCIQDPGEVVFTPSGWWHAVMNEKAGISLTENFINESNYDMVSATLLHLGKMEELKFVEQCMNSFLKMKSEKA